jgi:hypothetical protein
MRLKRYITAAAAVGLVSLGLTSQAALAFEETTVGAGRKPKAQAAPVLELPKAEPADAAKGLNLSLPETGTGLQFQSTGTEVRIPGLGAVGVLPKLDFGLELLYGANEPKGYIQDKESSPDDVQLRGTIKHRF